MLLVFWLVLACSPPKHPASTDLQKQALQIFARHLQAIGGEANLKAHKNSVTVGKVRRIDAPLAFRFTTHHIAPSSLLIELKSPSGGTFQRGFDGQEGWQMQGKQIRSLKGDELKRLKRKADFFFDLHFRSWYVEFTNIGNTQFAGRPCITIQAKNRNGEFEEILFDRETGLKIGNAIWQNEDQKHWIRYGHYIDIDGVQVPLSIEEKSDNMHKVTMLERLQWDQTIPPISKPSR